DKAAARRGGRYVYIADIDGAAERCFQRGERVEGCCRQGSGAVGDDEVAALRSLNQLWPFEGVAALMQHDLAERRKAGKRASAIVIVAHIGRVGEKDLHAAIFQFNSP